jgi:hypothetical protein
MRRYAFWFLLGIAACCPAGCGPKVVDVSGTVTYNGKPPNDEGCKITFTGPSGLEVTAPVAANGEYKATGVVVGSNKVVVFYTNPEAAKPRDPGVKAPLSTSPLRNLPVKYADVKTSGLTVDVAAGTVYNVELTGPALK